MKCVLKISSAKWGPFCLGLNVLRCWLCITPYLPEGLSRAAFQHKNEAVCLVLAVTLIMMVLGSVLVKTLRWRHNGYDSVSKHQHHGCLRNRLFRRRSKKTSKLRVIGLCAGNSPGTRWIPRKNGQLRGKCFHLMTSSWTGAALLKSNTSDF